MLYARDPNFILLISCLHEHTIMEQSFDIVEDVVNSCVGSFQLIYILTQNCNYLLLLYFFNGKPFSSLAQLIAHLIQRFDPWLGKSKFIDNLFSK